MGGGASMVKKELIFTDLTDVVMAHDIEWKCNVHTEEDFKRLDHIDHNDYYSRFEYRYATGIFYPDHVEVFCDCNWPYNPDLEMLKCSGCENWFHYDCVNLIDEERARFENGEVLYSCHHCAGN